uniref:CSON012178 protein n=1 Tax=Culicoides sonorensis TaxID=179676 RepID=A0A336K1Z3_CULSO
MRVNKVNLISFLLLIEVICAKKSDNDPILNNKEILSDLAKERSSDAMTSYDQRQTGKYNVHFNIKDVQLFSVRGDEFNAGLGDGMDYGDYGDYDYDPSHFTINPILAMLGVDQSSTTTTTTSTTEKPQESPIEGSFLNLPENDTDTIKSPSSSSPIVEITSKPIVTISTTQKMNENKHETTSNKPTVDELTTEYEKIPFETLMDPILRQLLRNNQKHNKAPFRLKAVYKRPHKYRVLPRRVINEFVIEGMPNRIDDGVDNQDAVQLAVGLPSRPLQNVPRPNMNNLLQAQQGTTRRPRRTRRPSEESSCFDGEYLDDFGRCIKLKEEKGEL